MPYIRPENAPIRHRAIREEEKESSGRYKKRFAILLSEGFTREEADMFSKQRIGTPKMEKGRRIRRAWYRDLKKRGIISTEGDLDNAVDELYRVRGWQDNMYKQFYPEGTGEAED